MKRSKVTHYCVEINTLCFGGVALTATALWVQASLAETQFQHGDPLSHPIYTIRIVSLVTYKLARNSDLSSTALITPVALGS